MPRSPKFKPGSDIHSFVVSEYQTGASLELLAEITESSVTAVRRALLDANVSMRPCGQPTRYKDGLTEGQRKHRKIMQDPERRKKYHLKSKRNRLRLAFGLSLEEYEELLESQDRACLICKSTFKDKLRPCVDHCHKTGNIRGILCTQCNTLLGYSYDSTDVLKAAIDYLNLPPYKSNSVPTQR